MTRKNRIEIDLEYTGGNDEPARGIFRNQVVEPEHLDELRVAVRSDIDAARPWPGNEGEQPQIHLAGSARALEELGRYLIALARLETADPEPYGSFDNVRNADGGTLRLLPRRLIS
jgi:hypothetical protein